MNRPSAPSRDLALSARSVASLIALVAVLVLAAHLVFGAGGLLNRAHVPPGLSAALAGPQARPVQERASASCLRAAPAVTAVRADNHDVFVRFAGRTGFMEIQYLKSEDAAIRYSYTHGSTDNFYDNTNWFDTPRHLTARDMHALAGCLPLSDGTS